MFGVLLQREIDSEADRVESRSTWQAFSNTKVWLLCLADFGFVMGLYGVGSWLPTLIKTSGISNATTIGWLTAVAYLAAVVCMIVVSRHSRSARSTVDPRHDRLDNTRARRPWRQPRPRGQGIKTLAWIFHSL